MFNPVSPMEDQPVTDGGFAAPNESNSYWYVFRGFQFGRVATCGAIVIAIVLIDRVAGSNPIVGWVVALTTADLLLTVPYLLIGYRYPAQIRSLTLGILYFEVGVVTTGVYLLGGEGLWYGLGLYGFLVVMAAALHSAKGAVGIGALGSLAYFGVILGVHSGALPMHDGALPFGAGEPWPWTSVVYNTLCTMALSIVAASLSSASRNALDRAQEYEVELRSLNRSLEARIETAVETLAAKNDQLERRTKQESLYSAALTHDLRNSLSAGTNFLQLAMISDDTSRQDNLETALLNLLRADEMLTGLRDLMRTAAEQPELEHVGVRNLLENLTGEISASRGGIDETPVYLIGKFSKIVAHPILLSHVLRNLIQNALIHNEGFPELRIEVEQEDREDSTLFVIRDNGAGIPKKARERIFQPFKTGPNTSNAGLGLGLSIVEKIVRQFGGEIWIEDSSGPGAEFRFSLPRADAGSAVRFDRLDGSRPAR